MNTTTVDVIERSQADVDNREARGAGQHQNPSTVAILESDGNKCEDQVDSSGNDNIEQNVGNGVSGCGEDLFRVVENYVDAAPLLQHRQNNPKRQHPQHPAFEQNSEIHLVCMIENRGLNLA